MTPKPPAPPRGAAKKGAKKAGKKSGAKSVAQPMATQPHGGALRVGSLPGNTPGTGRPPSMLRDQLRGSYGDRMAFLDRVIDGDVLQKAEISLMAVLPFIECPNCGEAGQHPKKVSDLLTVTFEAKVSASVKDRIAALEHQAKYGLGALKEVSVENVRERVAATLGVIRTHCSPDQAAEIITALRPVWA